MDALLVTPGPDLRYLLGLTRHSHERLSCLLLPIAGEPVFLVPRLERPGLTGTPVDDLGLAVADWVDGQDPYTLAAGLLCRDDPAPATVALADTMAAVHVLGFRRALPAAEQTLASPVLRTLRMRKDPAEVDALRRAGRAIDAVHAQMGGLLRAGRTEAEVGAEITAAIIDVGHTEAAFVIVGSGPNGASPHHDVSQRLIERGDVVVVDIGGPLPEGYHSDCTRTYAVGEAPAAQVRETYAVLQAAQQEAVATVRPGAAAQDVDEAARAVIRDAGFGEYFVHRTGHGIGLEVHEEPYIVGGNDLVLEPGMAFSVEPGIYLPGRWGARIEDIVVVTGEGCERLNARPRELVVL